MPFILTGPTWKITGTTFPYSRQVLPSFFSGDVFSYAFPLVFTDIDPDDLTNARFTIGGTTIEFPDLDISSSSGSAPWSVVATVPLTEEITLAVSSGAGWQFDVESAAGQLVVATGAVGVMAPGTALP